MKMLLRTASGSLAVLGCALWIGVSAAGASTTPTFTLDVQPGALTRGNSAALVATFTNKDVGVSGVAFTITFPFPVSVPRGGGCGSLPRYPNSVLCVVGVVGAGQTATTSFQFDVPSNASDSVTVNGTAGFLSPRPPRAGLIRASWTGSAYDPGAVEAFTPPSGQTVKQETSGCLGQGDTLSTSVGGFEADTAAGTDVTAGSPNSGPCAPIVTGVATDGNSNAILFFKASAGQDLTIVLTFPDEQLPGSGDHPGPLKEWPNYPSLSPDVVVPMCSGGDVIPNDSDACIVSVDTSSDPDGDHDAGTITVHAIGTAGDGGFHPG